MTTAPCLECAKRIHGAGIREVYYLEVYRSDDGLKFLAKAGIHIEKIGPNKDDEGCFESKGMSK